MNMQDDDPPEDQDDDQPEGEEDEPEGEEPEGEEDEEPEEGESQDPPAPKTKTQRASDRIAALTKRVETAEREAREAKESVNRPAPRDTTREDADERAAMAAMTDGEKTQYLMAKEIRDLKNQVGNVGRQTQDAGDRAMFSSYLSANPRFQKYGDEVEKMHREHSQRGGNPVTREFLLRIVIGNAVLTSKAPAKQKKAAAARLDGQRTRGTGVRSDTGGGNRQSGRSHVAKMEEADVPI